MADRTLYIFVEGLDEERFFKRVEPELKEKYQQIKIVKYARRKKGFVNNFIKSAESIGDYICIADIDLKKCVTLTKQQIKKRFSNINETGILPELMKVTPKN